MTDQASPITPPDALRAQWRTEAQIYRDFGVGREEWLIDRAAQWGWDQRGTINEAQLQERADQELKACCEWLVSKLTFIFEDGIRFADELRAARRPKPPSLKEQALGLLNEGPVSELLNNEVDIIRRALEALPND